MRRDVQTGYARGEETRSRILDVAIELFGIKGFDGVTTREVAAASSVPPASLRYYFQNKLGLYIACLEHVQAMTYKLVEPQLDAMEALLLSENVETDSLIESFCALQDARIESMMRGPDNGAAALFTIRHDLPSNNEIGNIDAIGAEARRMIKCYVDIMVRISGNTLDAQSALIVTGMISGQLTNIFLRRNRLSEVGWDVTPERIEWMKHAMRKHTTAILRSYQTD